MVSAWVSAVPFLMSSGLAIFGGPLTDRPFERMQGEIEREVDSKADYLTHELGPTLSAVGVAPEILQTITNTTRTFVSPSAIRKQAQDAASLAGIPHLFVLSALGYSLAIAGGLAPLLVAVAIIGSLFIQSKIDPYRRRGPDWFRRSDAEWLTHLVNATGLCVVILTAAM